MDTLLRRQGRIITIIIVLSSIFSNCGSFNLSAEEPSIDSFVTKFDQVMADSYPQNSINESYQSFIDSMQQDPFMLPISDKLENLIRDFKHIKSAEDFIIYENDIFFYNLAANSLFTILINDVSTINTFFTSYYNTIYSIRDIPPSLHDQFLTESGQMDLTNYNARKMFILHITLMYLTH